MQTFEIHKPKVLSPVKFIQFQLDLYLHENLGITDTQKLMIAYFFLYDNPIKKLVQDGHFKSGKSAQNYVSALRKEGILIGYKENTRVSPKLQFQMESFRVILNIHVENGATIQGRKEDQPTQRVELPPSNVEKVLPVE